MAAAPTLSRSDGQIDVVAGDMLWIGIHKIKLDGIVALDPSNSCSRNGRDQRCAIRMRGELGRYAERDDFRCELLLTRAGRPKFARGGRYSALCFTGDLEVNQELVARGWALAAAGNSGSRYKIAEQDARESKRGIHQYSFERAPAPPAKNFWSPLKRLIQNYPLMFAGGPAIGCVLLAILVILVRWQARRRIAQLRYDLGKARGVIEATATQLPPRPQPIKSLSKL